VGKQSILLLFPQGPPLLATTNKSPAMSVSVSSNVSIPLHQKDTATPALMTRPRTMTLPTQPGRTPAIYKPAAVPTSDPAHGAAFIFLHGLGDTAEGLESKLPFKHFIKSHLTF